MTLNPSFWSLNPNFLAPAHQGKSQVPSAKRCPRAAAAPKQFLVRVLGAFQGVGLSYGL